MNLEVTYLKSDRLRSDPFLELTDFELTHFSKWLNFLNDTFRSDQSFKVMDFGVMNFEVTHFKTDRLRSDPFLELTNFEVTHSSKWLNSRYDTFRSDSFLEVTSLLRNDRDWVQVEPFN